MKDESLVDELDQINYLKTYNFISHLSQRQGIPNLASK